MDVPTCLFAEDVEETHGVKHFVYWQVFVWLFPTSLIDDMFVAVDVEAVGILDLVEDDGTAADGLERAHRGVDAAGEDVLRSLENLRG